MRETHAVLRETHAVLRETHTFLRETHSVLRETHTGVVCGAVLASVVYIEMVVCVFGYFFVYTDEYASRVLGVCENDWMLEQG